MSDLRGRLKRRKQAEREATLETIANLAEGAVGRLEKSGYLTPEEVAASFCIEEGYNALVGSVGLRMMGWTGLGNELRPESLIGFLSTVRERLVTAFNAWHDELHSDNMLDEYQTVMEVLAGDSLALIEARNGWHNRKGKKMLKRGLRTYCDLNESFLKKRNADQQEPD